MTFTLQLGRSVAFELTGTDKKQHDLQTAKGSRGTVVFYLQSLPVCRRF